VGKCSFTGLVAHWTFDDDTPGVMKDHSAAGNHAGHRVAPGVLAAQRYGKATRVDGRVGGALEFSGRHWLSAGNNDCFSSDVVTVAAWVWQADDQGIVPTIAAKGAWPYNGWWLCTTTQGIMATQTRMLDFGIAAGADKYHVSSGYQLPLREWHHVVASLNNRTHEAEFFIDGKRFGERHTQVPTWHINWNHDLFIGEYDGSGRWPWRGRLDDVRVYNTQLSAQEVAQLFAAFPAAKTL
jgi:hypothetical protein